MLEKDKAAAIWEALKDKISEGYLLLSAEGRILEAGAAAQEVFRWPREELIGLSLQELVGDWEENKGFLHLGEAALRGEGIEALVSYRAKDGTEKKLRLDATPLKGKEILLLAKDETELRTLRSRASTVGGIQELNRELELRNRLLGETFGRYFSDSILKSLLDTPGGLTPGGKRQELTILMSDLRGFTMISESLPPEGLLAMLNHYLGEMTGVIQNHGGTIIEFIGDGIMAIFGAPIYSGAHADEGVAAALQMQSRMEQVNDWNRAKGFPALEMGIGVHTGAAILGNIGSEKRMKYGVVGNAVNVAGRLESYTVGG